MFGRPVLSCPQEDFAKAVSYVRRFYFVHFVEWDLGFSSVLSSISLLVVFHCSGMFRGHFEEASLSTIQMDGMCPIPSFVFEDLLRFIYCGVVEVGEGNAFHLLVGSKYFKLDQLAHRCEVLFVELV